MEIDQSQAEKMRFCPWAYYESYIRRVEPKKAAEGYLARDFGSRMHELLEEWYANKTLYTPHTNVDLEEECLLTMEAYKAKYPNEDVSHIVDVERPFRVALPNSVHVVTGKMDRVDDFGEFIDIWDHKSEKRSSKANTPQAWSEKDQPSIYMWAASKIYGKPVRHFVVNILTRQSDAGLIGPTFRRYEAERTERHLDMAIRDITVIADMIEDYKKRFGDEPWPANRVNCYINNWACDYQPLHGYGDDVDLVLEHKFQPKKEYLNLGGIPIIQ